MKTIWTKFRSALRDFRVARGGNVAITFAFATIPIIGAVGAGFDYSHANSVKADMQAALDSTALMLAKDAATLSSGDLNTKAMNYFTALFNRPNEASINSVSASYTATAGSQVVVNGSVNVPTTFLRVLGTSSTQNITVTGSSTTKWGSTRLRVALVLDNTGSMADDGKITALKSATHSLLTQLQNAAAQNGDVYVSIIPFSKDVNVGSANYNANWIDWDDWESANGSWQYVQNCSRQFPPRSQPLQRQLQVGSGQLQHLERLHHRSRPELRSDRNRAYPVRRQPSQWTSLDLVPGGAI